MSIGAVQVYTTFFGVFGFVDLIPPAPSPRPWCRLHVGAPLGRMPHNCHIYRVTRQTTNHCGELCFRPPPPLPPLSSIPSSLSPPPVPCPLLSMYTGAATPSPSAGGADGDAAGAGGRTLSPDAPPGATLAPTAADGGGSVDRGFGAATLSPDAPPGATLAPLTGDVDGNGLVNSGDTGIVGDTNGESFEPKSSFSALMQLSCRLCDHTNGFSRRILCSLNGIHQPTRALIINDSSSLLHVHIHVSLPLPTYLPPAHHRRSNFLSPYFCAPTQPQPRAPDSVQVTAW